MLNNLEVINNGIKLGALYLILTPIITIKLIYPIVDRVKI
jgi:hypothetical protein